jgi:hypothetical protein
LLCLILLRSVFIHFLNLLFVKLVFVPRETIYIKQQQAV